MGPNTFLFRKFVFLVLTLLIFLHAGCVRVPVSTNVAWKNENEIVESLNGASIIDVRSKLGEPTDTFTLRDVTYFFYKRDGEQKHFMYVLVPGWSEDQKTDIIIQCLLIESRNETVVHAEIKSYRAMLAWHLKYRKFRGCPSFFWGDEKLEQIEAAMKDEQKKLLYEATERGSLEAAIKLAEDYGDREPLRALAASGNRQAIAALKPISCQKIYYRADESSRPEADDKFVHVCEGDDLASKETVLISADWDKTYSSPPRRYFVHTPDFLK